MKLTTARINLEQFILSNAFFFFFFGCYANTCGILLHYIQEKADIMMSSISKTLQTTPQLSTWINSSIGKIKIKNVFIWVVNFQPSIFCTACLWKMRTSLKLTGSSSVVLSIAPEPNMTTQKNWCLYLYFDCQGLQWYIVQNHQLFRWTVNVESFMVYEKRVAYHLDS